VIFPILSGLLSWRKAPITWVLVSLNLLVLIYTSLSGLEAQDGLEEIMKRPYFVTTQGRVYAQYLHDHPRAEYPDFLLQMGERVDHGESDRAEVLGQLAFRDLGFLDSADTLDFRGDQVAFHLWQKQIGDVRLLQESHPSFTLGLNAQDTSFAKWISYIFVHSGFVHFLGNMLFLVIFGATLERQVGGLGLLVVFVLSGAMAAGAFALMTGVTSSPLVGASGAVSGVMTLFCVLNWSKPTRYFYWLFLPFRGWMGFVFLPSWVALVMWALNDLAGYLGTLAELGGVAHTAHLGGELAGLMTGLILLSLRRYWPVEIQPLPTDNAPMGVLYPLLAIRPREERKSA
jgi:membrane associated rhomboid family serine protease